jgi:DEAD/DEAH box helicase domain-containing protein
MLVVVDDGEAGEVTILQVRAKMYALDKTQGKDGKEEAAWKERGVGNLKINVPEECVEFDENGAAIPDSFDASVLQADADDDEEAAGEKRPKVVRLILRQDSTLRVILNTAIWGHTEFQEKSTLKSSNIIFTAFEEGGKVVNVQMKASHPLILEFLSLL